MFNWNIKESPILSLLGMGGGIGSRLISGVGGVKPQEFVIFGGNGSSTTGTITDIGSLVNITVSGTGAGGNGSPNHPGSCCPGRGGGGGAAANTKGNTFPIPGNSITSIYYQVGGTNTAADTFIQINGPGGTDLIRFQGGNPNPNQAGGTGGPATGGGPNCVGGGNGANGGERYGGGGSAADRVGGCAGGGGSGGAVDNGQPGTTGGVGGESSSVSGQITTNGTGPNSDLPIAAPTTWSWQTGTFPGGPAGVGSRSNYSNGTNAGDRAYAQGGGGGGVYAPDGSGNLGAGGAGCGQKWSDPSDPTNHDKFFGGGGGALGAIGASPDDGYGGKGILIIQLTA